MQEFFKCTTVVQLDSWPSVYQEAPGWCRKFMKNISYLVYNFKI